MASRPTVLVVDDEPDIRDALTTLLEELLDLKVVTANSGGDGVKVLATLGDDLALVLSDFRMPGMDGLEFLAHAKKARPEVPRVLITAYADTSLAVRAVDEAKISRFLPKPLEPAQVEAMVKEILATSGAERQRNAAMQRTLDLLKKRGSSP